MRERAARARPRATPPRDDARARTRARARRRCRAARAGARSSCGRCAADSRRSWAKSSMASACRSSSGPLSRRTLRTGCGSTRRASRSRSRPAMRCGCAPTGCTKRSRTRVTGAVAMPQLHFERLHAATALAQEAAQLVEQRLERAAQALGVGRVSGSRSRRGVEFLAGGKGRAGFRHAGRSHGRACEQVVAEAARKAVARQAQAVAHRAHAHGRQRLQRALGPARAAASGSGASRAARSSRLRTNSGRAPGRPARANHSDASGAGVMARRGRGAGGGGEFLLQARAQRARAAEQPQAAAHFEQHGVGRLEADARREAQPVPRHGFEQLSLAAQVARQRVQRRHERERSVDRHAVAHPGGLHGRIAGAHDLAVAVEVDDRDGRLPGQRLHGCRAANRAAARAGAGRARVRASRTARAARGLERRVQDGKPV